MKILHPYYTFVPSTRTIVLNGLSSPISLNNVLLITNVTDNIIIYNFANPLLGGQYNTNTLTLLYDTSGMSNTDILQIFIDDGSVPATEQAVEELQEHTILLRRLLKLMESNATVDSSLRQRVTVDTGSYISTVAAVTTVSTVSTVTAVTSAQTTSSLSNLSLVPTHENQIQWSRNEWANCIRNKLEFS